MTLKYSILIFLLAGLVACDQQQFSTDQEKFEAYLKIKRISLDDETRVERQRTEYLRRAAMANAIYETDRLDRAQIDAELEEFRKELIISDIKPRKSRNFIDMLSGPASSVCSIPYLAPSLPSAQRNSFPSSAQSQEKPA